MGLGHNLALPTGLHWAIDFSNSRCYSGTGVTIFDLNANNGNNLISVNNPTFTSAGTNSYLTLNGTNQHANRLNPLNSINVQGPYTICIVFAGNSTSATQNIFSITDNASSSTQIGYRTDVATGSIWKFGGTSILQFTYPGIGVTAHLAFTSDGSNNSRVYMNGSSVNSGVVAMTTGVSKYYSIGTFNAGGTELYNGKIFYISVHDRVLNPGEVRQCYDAVKRRFQLPGSGAGDSVTGPQ